MKLERNASKKFVAVALASTMALSMLCGCSSKNEKKYDTSLKGTMVLTLEDNQKDIVNFKGYCSNATCDNKLYKSLFTDEYIIDDSCKDKYYDADFTHRILNHRDIISADSILSYLTTDEMVKMLKDELTEEDVTIITKRILDTNEKSKVK